MRLAGTIFLVALCANAFGQTLKRAEYFFDSDPGKGNGTSLSITQAASSNQTFNINISSLSAGTHTFNIRFVDSNGHWSLFDSRTFFVLTSTAALTASTIKKVEYFFDNDPGTGKATAITITAAGTQKQYVCHWLGFTHTRISSACHPLSGQPWPLVFICQSHVLHRSACCQCKFYCIKKSRIFL